MTEFKVGDKVIHAGHGEVEITYGPYLGTFGRTNVLVKLPSGREAAHRIDDLTAIPTSPAFAIGDKVTAGSTRVGKLVAGPFVSRSFGTPFWVMEYADGQHSAPRQPALTKVDEPEPVKVGDLVRILRATYAVSTHGKIGTVQSVGHEWRADSDDIHPYMVCVGDDTIHVAELERVDEDDAVKVGDVVRILKDGANRADVKAGDLLVVVEIPRYADINVIRVKAAPGARMVRWTFRPQDFEKVSADEVVVHDGKVYDLTRCYRDTDGDFWTFKRLDGVVRGSCGASAYARSSYVTSSSDTLASVVRDYGPLTKI